MGVRSGGPVSGMSRYAWVVRWVFVPGRSGGAPGESNFCTP
jgi:hypothetical protein